MSIDHQRIQHLLKWKTFFGQRQEEPPLVMARGADRHLFPRECAATVFHARGQNLFVQCREIFGLRYRHQTVTPMPSQLALRSSLFVPLCRVAVLALISPVRTKSDDP